MDVHCERHHTYPSPTCSVPAHAIHESGLPVNAWLSRYYDGADNNNITIIASGVASCVFYSTEIEDEHAK